jgi:hypothetical protein
MNVTICLTRGEIPFINYDPVFMRRLEARLEQFEEEGSVKDPSSLYSRLRRAHRDLIDVVERVMGDEAKEPFTITLAVDGRNKVYPPGTALY